MLEINHTWTPDGASTAASAMKPVFCGQLPISYSLLTVSASTLASTTSFQFQTGQSSAGPWFVEGSTSISATNSAPSQDIIRITGPYQWMRPVLKTVSTGTYTFRLIGVS